MSYFFIVTDTNSRQYIFKVEDCGIPISTISDNIVITIEQPNLHFFAHCFDNDIAFTVNNSDCFKPSNLTAVQLRSIPEEIN